MNIMRISSIVKLSLTILFCYSIFNAFKIYQFSKVYSNEKADVAIILGAGTKNGKLSPVFKQRINQGIQLYKENKVKKLILTDGIGKGESISDSQIAKEYVLKNGVPNRDILIEKKSKYTLQNLDEAKIIMDSLKLETALLVSDPLHMKRSICMAKKKDIICFSSPTQTSMYKTKKTKIQFLMYETFFYTLGKLSGRN